MPCASRAQSQRYNRYKQLLVLESPRLRKYLFKTLRIERYLVGMSRNRTFPDVDTRVAEGIPAEFMYFNVLVLDQLSQARRLWISSTQI